METKKNITAFDEDGYLLTPIHAMDGSVLMPWGMFESVTGGWARDSDNEKAHNILRSVLGSDLFDAAATHGAHWCFFMRQLGIEYRYSHRDSQAMESALKEFNEMRLR